MQQNNSDNIRLRHMLDYAQKAVAFTSGKKRNDLDNDEMLAMATIHAIEIIGEAANSISQDIRNSYPEIPWDLVVGTRNRLAHGYIEVDLDIIWAIVTRDLPPLIASLKRILEKESSET
jgi:uncharacterized protein with HEPN domain